ncbi:hypothetical protein FA15DRAFT_664543 [Coprinopsis marcescibilis]|uniref:F-box domain-containing protein n=1 Tax=Coprinopsis marcescibilis TaxID=230819 RepID=A0A5C3L827_COPMA|nr:hypothetical protein FA15DRAFT_664543 [Coprinopsis marcescibilis]
MVSGHQSLPSCNSCGSYLPQDSLAELDVEVEDDFQIDALRDEIDSHIARLNLQVRELSRRRNNLARINRRLPPEVMRRIFLQCSVQDKIVCFRKQMEWIKITHVCSEWRALAIDHAELWSRIPLRTVFWARRMLARTKQAPISVELASGYVAPACLPEMQTIVSTLLAQTSRLRSVDLTATAEHTKHYLECFDSTAPELEFLSIYATPSYSYHSDEGPQVYYGPVIFPDQFLSGGAPRLHTILLHNCTLPANISSMSLNLTTLSAEYRHPSPTFLNAIGNLQSLRRLNLELPLPTQEGFGIPIPEEVTFIEHPPVVLAQLEKLQLQGSFFLCIGTLSCFRIPSSAVLAFACSKTSESLVSNIDHFNGSSSHLQRVLDTSWLSSSISLRSAVFRTVTVYMYPGLYRIHAVLDKSEHSLPTSSMEQHDNQDISSVSKPSLMIEIGFGYNPTVGAATSTISNLWWLNAMPGAAIVDLQQLEVEIPELDPASFRQISGSLPLLEHIVLGNSCSFSFANAVESDVAVELARTGSPTLFPKLKTIVFDSAAFLQSWDMATGTLLGCGLSTLADSISIRNEHGGVTQSLEVKNATTVSFSEDGRVQRFKSRWDPQLYSSPWNVPGPWYSNSDEDWPVTAVRRYTSVPSRRALMKGCSGKADCRCYYGT